MTASNLPRHDGSRPAISACAVTTVTRALRSSRPTARWRKSVRRTLASRRTRLVSGRARATTRPGTPPPAPRSRIRRAGRRAARKPAAWLMWLATGPGPRNPSNADSARTSSRAAGSAPGAGSGVGGGADDDAAERLLALGDGLDTVELVGGIVHHLAVHRRHRLQRPRRAAGADLGRDLGREAG